MPNTTFHCGNLRHGWNMTLGAECGPMEGCEIRLTPDQTDDAIGYEKDIDKLRQVAKLYLLCQPVCKYYACEPQPDGGILVKRSYFLRGDFAHLKDIPLTADELARIRAGEITWETFEQDWDAQSSVQKGE